MPHKIRWSSKLEITGKIYASKSLNKVVKNRTSLQLIAETNRSTAQKFSIIGKAYSMFSFTKSPPKKSKGSHKFPVLKIGAFETAFLIADIQSGESNFWHSSPCEEKFSTLKTNSPHKKKKSRATNCQMSSSQHAPRQHRTVEEKKCLSLCNRSLLHRP